MNYIWKNYNPETMEFVEEWLDKEAVDNTGMDDGWKEFHNYWCSDENTVPDKNYWCKAVYENEKPIAVTAIGYNEGKYNIMELVVRPDERGKGKGSSLLKELLINSTEIIGSEITEAEAVIYPSNPASQKAFEKAGFVFDYAHEDGDVFYYIYRKTAD